jgi:hypothetical protein
LGGGEGAVGGCCCCRCRCGRLGGLLVLGGGGGGAGGRRRLAYAVGWAFVGLEHVLFGCRFALDGGGGRELVGAAGGGLGHLWCGRGCCCC